jgi:hypothetical protein
MDILPAGGEIPLPKRRKQIIIRVYERIKNINLMFMYISAYLCRKFGIYNLLKKTLLC